MLATTSSVVCQVLLNFVVWKHSAIRRTPSLGHIWSEQADFHRKNTAPNKYSSYSCIKNAQLIPSEEKELFFVTLQKVESKKCIISRQNRQLWVHIQSLQVQHYQSCGWLNVNKKLITQWTFYKLQSKTNSVWSRMLFKPLQRMSGIKSISVVKQWHKLPVNRLTELTLWISTKIYG